MTFLHVTMCLYHVHVSTKFEANRSKNTVTVAQNSPKWTFLRHYVATSLRHDVFFTWYNVPIPCPCFHQIWSKYIGLKTRPQWPKKPQNGRFYVITSWRHDVFFTWYDAPMPCPCFHQILSKSVEKHGHGGQNKFSRRRGVMTSWRRDVMTPLTPRAMVIPIMRPNMKKIGWKTKSLNDYKYDRRGVVIIK